MEVTQQSSAALAGAEVPASASRRQPTSRDLADWYYRQVREAENSRINGERRLTQIAWRVAAGSMVIALLAILGAGGLVLLKRPDPPVVLRDNTATGDVDVIDVTRSGQITFGELEDRADLRRYVEDREGYDWETIQDMYNVVKAMSAPGERERYAALFDSRSPGAPQNVLKDQFRVIAKAGPITFVGSTAQVFFSKKIIALGNNVIAPRTEYWVATIAYEHHDLPEKKSELELNRTGFAATSYTVDRDWTRTTDQAPAVAAVPTNPVAPMQPANGGGTGVTPAAPGQGGTGGAR